MQTHCCHQLLKTFIASKEGEKIRTGGAGGLILGPMEIWAAKEIEACLHRIYIISTSSVPK
jgi:hypothetical protein